MAKPGYVPGNDRDVRQAVNARQLLQCTARCERDARLTEPRTAGAGRPMWACRHQSPTGISSRKLFKVSPFQNDESILYRHMSNLIHRSTGITSPAFTQGRVSMVFAPNPNRMRIDRNVPTRVIVMAPPNRRG